METAKPATAATPQTETGPQMPAPPQAEHAWLQKLVGNWTFESECGGGPDQPPVKFRGTETVKPLGNLWIVGEGQSEMSGGDTDRMMITLGFDPKRKRFVGTWVGSMMHHLWIYDGELDPSGRVLTLYSVGPSFTDPAKQANYQDIIEIKANDHRTLTARVQGDDGQWTQFMTAHYRRKK